MTCLAKLTACLLACAPVANHAATLRVDVSRSGRNDTRAPDFVEWQVNPAQATTNFDGVNITLRQSGGDASKLEGGLYKSGIDTGARLACDGVLLRGAEAAAGMELVFSGLIPGPHSLATFHNLTFAADPAAHRFDVSLNGAPVLTNVQPTVMVASDYDCASAFVRFTAEAGKDVVVKFTPSRRDASRPAAVLVLNGFELDRSNPAARAGKPAPANDDEHMDADNGSAKLSWVAGAGAVSRDLYFATSTADLANADRTSHHFKGNLPATSFTVTKLNHSETYFWRVDEVDASGTTTRGDLWRFRPRFLAFPTAEGYGRFARGGRDGRVIEVTNLDDSGPGSLREAVEASGPRTVVFNVSGLITLESKLIVRGQYLTIAGQTAPGRGICVRKMNLGMLGARDVIIRHLRVRPGNLSGMTLDGMGMASSDHCIIDHCSVSWTLDEAFSSRGAKNITLQRTLISEALNEAGHKKYPPGTQHGYAASIGGLVGSFHHNLLAHNAGRNWSLAGGLNQGARHTGWLDLRNNVVFNWKHRATDGGAARVQFVNNYYKPGPATTLFAELVPQFENPGFGPQIYFIEGNVLEGRHGAEGPLGPFEGVRPRPATPWKEFTVPTPWFESFVTTHSAAECYTNVLADVGCNRPALDEHDARIIAEVRDGTAKFKGSKTGLPGLPDSQDDVGGWENYPVERRPANWDSDHDGMPDEWERARGLSPSDPRDGNADRDGDGFTNLEEYLGWLVGEFGDAKVPARK